MKCPDSKDSRIPLPPRHKVGLLTVHKAFGQKWSGRLQAGHVTIRCALGKNGIRSSKREGDHATPRGSFSLIEAIFRPGRTPRPKTHLPLNPIRPQDGWSDDRLARQYNRPIRLPSRDGHERLYRHDHVYDVVIVLDYNLRPRVRGHGSAIFFHLARTGYGPTEGCIAISAADMRRLLPRLGQGVRMRIV